MKRAKRETDTGEVKREQDGNRQEERSKFWKKKPTHKTEKNVENKGEGEGKRVKELHR